MSIKNVSATLASRIRTLRNSKGWTQERLAEEIDVHTTYISRIESAKKLPTLPIICRIAESLGVETYELLVDEGKTRTTDYKIQKIINIVRDSRPGNIDIYSTLLDALHKKSKTKRRQ